MTLARNFRDLDAGKVFDVKIPTTTGDQHIAAVRQVAGHATDPDDFRRILLTLGLEMPRARDVARRTRRV